MNKEEKSKTIKLPIIISLVLSISIIIIILFFTLDAETINHLSTTNIRYEFFIAAIAIEFVYWVLWGLRIKILSNAIETSTKIGLWESAKIVFANLFLANITPSMAGGEPVRIYLLNKDGLRFSVTPLSQELQHPHTPFYPREKESLYVVPRELNYKSKKKITKLKLRLQQ